VLGPHNGNDTNCSHLKMDKRSAVEGRGHHVHAFNGKNTTTERRTEPAKTIVNRRGNVTNEFYAQFHFMPECPRVTKPAKEQETL